MTALIILFGLICFSSIIIMLTTATLPVSALTGVIIGCSIALFLLLWALVDILLKLSERSNDEIYNKQRISALEKKLDAIVESLGKKIVYDTLNSGRISSEPNIVDLSDKQKKINELEEELRLLKKNS